MNRPLPRFPGPSIELSLLGVAAGSVVGIVLIPDSLTVPEDLRWPAVALSAGVLLGPLMAALRRPESILHPTSILLVGVFYWLLLDLVQALYLPEVRNPDVVPFGFLAIGLFAGGVCVAGAFRTAHLPALMVEAAQTRFGPQLLFKLGTIAFLLAFLRFAIPADFDLLRMFNALFLGRWAAPWARGAYGGWDSFLDHLAYFGYMLPALAVLQFRLENKLTWRVVLLAVMATVIVLLVAQGGGRRIIGVLVGSAGVVWVLTSRRKRASMLTLSIFGVPAFLTYLQYVLLTRSSGIGGAGSAAVGEVASRGISVDDNFNRLCQLIEIIPAYASHVGFDWVIWILVRPIPRALWPGKPDGVGFNLPEYLGMKGISLTASVVGEAYTAFGLIGCLVTGILFGYLARWLARLLEYRAYPGGVLMFALGLLALFVGLRSAIEILLMSYAIVAWIVLSHFIGRKTRRHAVA